MWNTPTSLQIAPFYFWKDCTVFDLNLTNVIAENSTGYGLLGFNLLGNSFITNSDFRYNRGAQSCLGGNIKIFYVSCLNFTTFLTIDSSQFLLVIYYANTSDIHVMPLLKILATDLHVLRQISCLCRHCRIDLICTWTARMCMRKTSFCMEIKVTMEEVYISGCSFSRTCPLPWRIAI